LRLEIDGTTGRFAVHGDAGSLFLTAFGLQLVQPEVETEQAALHGGRLLEELGDDAVDLLGLHDPLIANDT
jgi:hypothetical protein